MTHNTHWTRTLIPLLLLASTETQAASTPPPDDQAPPELLDLRDAMAREGEAHALKHKSHFRPLCDAEGYPLVGNLVPKDPEDMPNMVEPVDPPFQPSEFCEQIRMDERA